MFFLSLKIHPLGLKYKTKPQGVKITWKSYCILHYLGGCLGLGGTAVGLLGGTAVGLLGGTAAGLLGGSATGASLK